MCGKCAHNRIFFMKYMHAIGQHERLSLASVAGADVQVENRFAKNRRDNRIAKLKIECQPTQLIFE